MKEFLRLLKHSEKLKEFFRLLQHPEEMSNVPAYIILVAVTVTVELMAIWAI